jgi:hypothetical protein
VLNLRDLWKHLTNRRRRADGSMFGDRPDGSRVFLDAETVKYVESDGPTPNQQQLEAMLSRARRVRVTMSVDRGDRVDRELILLIRDPREIASLGATLRISDEPCGHCMCLGDPHLTFLDERDVVLAEISLHHGRSIRWSAWRDDALLLDGREVLEWLASRGASAPLDDYEAERREEEAAHAAWEEWHACRLLCRDHEHIRPGVSGSPRASARALCVVRPGRGSVERVPVVRASTRMPAAPTLVA